MYSTASTLDVVHVTPAPPLARSRTATMGSGAGQTSARMLQRTGEQRRDRVAAPRAPVADLAVTAIAPAHHVAIAGHRTRVADASGELLSVAEAGRGRGSVDRVIRRLARLVRSRPP